MYIFSEVSLKMNNKIKPLMIAASFFLAAAVTFITAKAVSPLMFDAAASLDPCVLKDDEVELREFVDLGKSSSETTSRKTTGTITKIIKNHDETRSFYIERLSPSTRERTCLRIEDYSGTETINVGDYVSVSGALSVSGDDYWVTAPAISSYGQNSYGQVSALELSEIEAEDYYSNGRYAYALKFTIGDLYSGYTYPVTSEDGALLYSSKNSSGSSFYPILVDGGTKDETNAIANKLVSASSSAYFKSYGNLVSYSGSWAFRISSSSDLTLVDPNVSKTVDFYAINDFHGETDKISSLVTFFKEKKSDNTVFINSGDMWQGSMLSNTNYGKLLTSSFDEIGFDCFTLGNHEFDWGLNYIIENKESTKTPFLGANIYHWDQDKKEFGDFASELVEPYAIKDLDNGLRVGIIGIIGKDQITSITSSNVATVGFKDPSPIVASYSETLRNEKGCDIVVLSAHTGQSDVMTDEISSSVDAVFCAHTHKLEEGFYNEIPYIQGKSYGSYVSNVKITIKDGSIESRTKENIAFSASSYGEDAEMKAIVDSYAAPIEERANEELATFDSGLSSNVAVPRLVAHAMANEASKEGYTIDLAMCNKARSTISSGSLTYSSLYESVPFDNIVYIATVTGNDLIAEAGYNPIYRVNGAAFEGTKTYTIAILDYLLFHQGSDRSYDYFDDGFTIIGNLSKEGYGIYNYRDVTADFLREKKTISTSFYTDTNDHNNTNSLTSEVSI